jgi:hypothetical protein
MGEHISYDPIVESYSAVTYQRYNIREYWDHM